MSLTNQLNKITGTLLDSTRSNIKEANIIAIGNASDRYKIKFRDGSTASNVIGQTGLSIGDSVLVRSSEGKISSFAILSKNYSNSGDIVTFYV